MAIGGLGLIGFGTFNAIQRIRIPNKVLVVYNTTEDSDNANAIARWLNTKIGVDEVVVKRFDFTIYDEMKKYDLVFSVGGSMANPFTSSVISSQELMDLGINKQGTWGILIRNLSGKTIIVVAGWLATDTDNATGHLLTLDQIPKSDIKRV